jgi:hypothetical protein
MKAKTETVVLGGSGFLSGRPRAVEAEVIGPLCVHLDFGAQTGRRRYRLAHINSGAAIGARTTKTIARRVAREILALHPSDSPMWSKDNAETIGQMTTQRDRRKVDQVLKRAGMR